MGLRDPRLDARALGPRGARGAEEGEEGDLFAAGTVGCVVEGWCPSDSDRRGQEGREGQTPPREGRLQDPGQDYRPDRGASESSPGFRSRARACKSRAVPSSLVPGKARAAESLADDGPPCRRSSQD